ncbi:MAG TPA: hypothetical protein VLB82_14090 [Thermodesulfobacteriota bacterium]|nr:hypothetical protein [Thermodesulfobacteriota bacterium]
MVDRNTKIRASQVLDFDLTKNDLIATGETTGYVLTVQGDGTLDYEQSVLILQENDIQVESRLLVLNIEDGIAYISEGNNKATIAIVDDISYIQTFNNSDLISDTIIISHKLDLIYPIVMVYDNNDNIIYPTEIKYLNKQQIELDFSGITPISGNYKVRIVGRLDISTYTETFINADLISDKITINHNLNIRDPFIIVYSNEDNLIFPNEISYINNNSIELDFTSGTPLIGTYKIRVAGSGNIDSFRKTFVNADLTSNKITINHNLSTDYPVVVVYDNSNNYILPDEITYINSNSIQLDFTSFGTLTGTYSVNILGENIKLSNAVSDLDKDTKVQVEASEDEDKIRFITAGSERVIIDDFGNVGIGTSTVTTDTLLELSANDKAFLIPRLTSTQRDALTTTNGMLIYNSTTDKFQGRAAGVWVDLH